MAVGILLALLAGAMWTVNACTYAVSARRRFEAVAFLALGASLATVGSLALVNWPGVFAAGPVPGLRGTVLATLGSAILNTVGMVCILKSFECGHQGVSWTLSQLGMVVPFLVAVGCWGESARWWQHAGLATVVVAMLFLMPRQEKEPSAGQSRAFGRWLMYALSGLVLVGGGQLLYILPSRYYGNVPADWRTCLFLVGYSASTVALAMVYRQRVSRAMLGPASLLAVGSILALWLIALSGNRLAVFGLTGLVYPVTTASSVVMFSLCSQFVFHEPFQKTTWLGIGLTSVGIFLLGYR